MAMQHKRRLALIPGLLVLAIALSARAQEQGASLVQEKMCYACHQMEAASLGPPWRAIAARHAARRELMIDVLAGKIIRGGGGNWGLVPMVPNQRVSEEEARVLADWVLRQVSND
jgi:cytochrome c